jgi:predicted ATPase
MAEGWGVIEHIEIEGFKSLEKVSLDLGPLNIFVGTNASGKTNFLEALRVLQGIGYGYTVDEIFNGKPKGPNSEVWDGIRGGSKFARFLGSTLGVRFVVNATFPTLNAVEYTISISPDDSIVTNETFSTREGDHSLIPEYAAQDRSVPGLREFIRSRQTGLSLAFLLDLCDVQFLAPAVSVQRGYSMASTAVRLGNLGENFASVVRTIQRDETKASAFVSWLRELTPAELDSVEILPGAAGDWLFALRKDGVDFPAPVLSDGTLRFAAIAAAFFQPSLPCTLVLEEIEDGLHPTRLRLLVELLKSQAGNGISQVFATSHSPYAIAWLKEEDYKHVFLFTKNEETGATSITPFSKIPRLMELARTQSIADLFAEGWLESAV